MTKIDKIVKHPVLEGLVPVPTEAEYDNLKNSIKDNGYQNAFPIIIDTDWYCVDGYTRLRICEQLDIKDVDTKFAYFRNKIDTKEGIEERVNFAIRANVNRRHLTSEQKRELIAKIVAITPAKSIEQIHKDTGISNEVISDVKAEQGLSNIPVEVIRDGNTYTMTPHPAVNGGIPEQELRDLQNPIKSTDFPENTYAEQPFVKDGEESLEPENKKGYIIPTDGLRETVREYNGDKVEIVLHRDTTHTWKVVIDTYRNGKFESAGFPPENWGKVIELMQKMHNECYK